MKRNWIATVALAALCVIPGTANNGDAGKKVSKYETVEFEDIKVGGELQKRLHSNLNRLQEGKYQPDNVFLTEQQSGNWPGDTEGRTILGLVMDARALGKEPLYLDEIIRRVPAKLNRLGYMGTIHGNMLDEQQLSGNGWMLRGLCEYYLWKNDSAMLPIIRRMAESLFVAGEKHIGAYPIQPDGRLKNVGEASGSISQVSEHWRLSTDVGCVFIGMDGLIHALQVSGDRKLQPAVEKLIALFLKIDLAGIKAQTHATLTAMRGLLRYADFTGDTSYIKEVEKRWELYKNLGMTELYGNYNWFRRYETWTEPCAIVDSYIVAAQLWQHTGKAEYRDDAELIYYNALAPAQRPNGGFGLENSPGVALKTPAITPNCDEAHWCCTMRGGEGLGRVANYTAFVAKGELAIPFLREAEITAMPKGRKALKVKLETGYPFDEAARVRVIEAPRGKITMSFAKYPWLKNYSVTVNGKEAKYVEADGLAKVTRRFKSGDNIEIKFDMSVRYAVTLNKENTLPNEFRLMYGPLVLGGVSGNGANIAYGEKFKNGGGLSFAGEKSGVVVSPVYHLMSPKVLMNEKPAYSRRILFAR